MSNDDIEHLANELERRQGEADRRKGNSSFVRSDLGKTILNVVITVLIAWSVVQVRLAVLESQVQSFKESIAEIRNDVKTLLLRVR